MSFSGYDWEEVEGSPRENFDVLGGRHSFEREFRVDWGQRWTFAAAMSLSGYPGFAHVVVGKIGITPEIDDIRGAVSDPTSALPVYDTARVKVTYEPVSIESASQPREDGTWLSYDRSGESEFLTLPSRALKWSDNSEPVAPDANAALLIPKRKHVLTWHRVPAPDWSVLQALEGKVNDDTFAVPIINLSCTAEQLLFESSSVRGSFSVSGSADWDVTITLAEKRITSYGGDNYGWNHAYRDDPEGWARPVNGDGDPSYALGDFEDLFVQAS